MPVTYRELVSYPQSQYSSSSKTVFKQTYTDSAGSYVQSAMTSQSGHSSNDIGSSGTTNIYHNFGSATLSNSATYDAADPWTGGTSSSSIRTVGSTHYDSRIMDSVPLQTLSIIKGTEFTSHLSYETQIRTSYVDSTTTTFRWTTSYSYTNQLETDTTFTIGTNYLNRGTYDVISIYDTTLTSEVDETTSVASMYYAKTTKSNTYTTATDATSTGTTTYLIDTTIAYTSTKLETTKTESKVYKTTSASVGYSTEGMTSYTVSIPQYSENMYTQKTSLSLGESKVFSDAFDETSSYANPRAYSSFIVPTTSESKAVSWTSLSEEVLTIASTSSNVVPAGTTTFTSQYTTEQQVSTSTYTRRYESIEPVDTTLTTGYSLTAGTGTGEGNGVTYTFFYSTTINSGERSRLVTYNGTNVLVSITTLNSFETITTTYSTTFYYNRQLVNSSGVTLDTETPGLTMYSSCAQAGSSSDVFALSISHPKVATYNNSVQAYGKNYEQLVALPGSNITIFGKGLVGNDLLSVSFSSVRGGKVMVPFILTDQTYSTSENSVSFTYSTAGTTSSLTFAFSTLLSAKTSVENITNSEVADITTIANGFSEPATLSVNGFYKVNGVKGFTNFSTTISNNTAGWYDKLNGYKVNGFDVIRPIFITYTS